MLYEKEHKQETKRNVNGIKVLVIDDDKAVRRFLHVALNAHGYDVYEVETGQEGMMKIVSFQPDLILLDIDLPDMNGIEIVRTVREWVKTPVLILSVDNHDTVKVEALDSGADDYVVKPFSMSELMARMRAALRHVQYAQSTSDTPVFTIGDLQVNLATRIVEVRGQPVDLTPTEYDLLKVMVSNAGKVITHQQLWRQIRSENNLVDSHLIRVHMSNLRRKLEADPTNPQYILTEPGVGYRLRAEV